MLGGESLAPYERPGLSKQYLRGEESVAELFVRPPGWYEEQEIELRTGCRAGRIDPASREIAVDSQSG